MKAMLAVIALSAATFAQEPNPRRDVFWRLRHLEQHWRANPIADRTIEKWMHLKDKWRAGSDAERRGKALVFVVEAQGRFAAGEFGECCKALDTATREIALVQNGNDSLTMRATRRLCDRAEKQMAIVLERQYRVWTNQLITFSARCGDFRFDDMLRIGREPGPWRTSFDLSELTTGDHYVELGLFDGDFDESLQAMTVSVVDHRDERLAKLKADIEKLGDKAPALERETAKATLALLESLARGSTEAHEYPGARLLEETEQVVAAAAKGERWYSSERAGEFWLSLPIDGGSVRTRVLVPERLSKEKNAPLVVAFHGAAFDEDVWFDGYGGGAAVENCRKRGWIFAALHCEGGDGAMRVEAAIDALSRIYPIDAKHTFLLGHSRGAGTALRAQAATPDRYCGVAAIGNALDDASAKALTNHPLFLAAGDHDFAREAVTGMSKTLTDAGSKSVKLSIYPNTEHWLAVQAALPDAFAWFDSLAK